MAAKNGKWASMVRTRATVAGCAFLLLGMSACSGSSPRGGHDSTAAGAPATAAAGSGVPIAAGSSAPPAGTAGSSNPTSTGSAGSAGSSAGSGAQGAAGTAITNADAATHEPSPDAGGPEMQPDSGTAVPPDPDLADCAGDGEADFSLVGWATEAGGTTGGRGGMAVTVHDGAALMQALKDKPDGTPLTIRVEGTITEANSSVDKIDVKDVQDVSIIGLGAGAELNGIGIKIVRASNVVIRNLKIHNVLIGDKDGISIEGPADHIWIDHCELYSEYQDVDKDYYDGLLDAKAETQYLTYSWNSFHDSWKTMLVGSSETDTFDRKLTVHHNLFRNCNSRLPLFRGGNGHIFNNAYVDIADTGINARLGACLLIEANAFSNAKNPWVSAFSDALGAGQLRCNVTADGSAFAYSDDVHELPTCTAQVPYDYAKVLNAPGQVSAVVTDKAGVGKLTDPEQF